MGFSPPAVPAERFVAPSHPEPLNQPRGQTTPKGTETASLMVLETSLQPCLSLLHLGLSSWKIFISGLSGIGQCLETVVRWRGRVSIVAWQC